MQFRKPPSSIDELDFKWAYYPGGVVLESDYWRNLPSHSVDCSCNACKNRNQSDIIENYCYNDLGEIDNSSMGYVAKLHGGLSAELEYSKIKKYIKSNEINDYISELEEYQKKYFLL